MAGDDRLFGVCRRDREDASVLFRRSAAVVPPTYLALPDYCDLVTSVYGVDGQLSTDAKRLLA
jgi:hypothetical protein